MSKRLIGCLSLALCLGLGLFAFFSTRPAKNRVLVYTHNGPLPDGRQGFVHDNIATCAEAIRQLGEANGFAVDVSDDPAIFADESLKRYRVLVFDNTNNKTFDTTDQKAAFQRFIHAGGGFVGIHSASGSERYWPWYWRLIGGTFKIHAPFQPFTVKVMDPHHPSTAGYPAETFPWTDEFYFLDHMPDDLHILLAGDMTKLNFPTKAKYRTELYGDWHPLTWCHEFEGGRAWYTALGHPKSAYADPLFRKLILGGILWAMGTGHS
jgi:type 1 glutamine amidotransferase